jgi:hypothetical protein
VTIYIVSILNVVQVHLVHTSMSRKANCDGNCDILLSMRSPQLARAFRVEMRAFVYSFESEKSQTKLLQNDH